MLADAEFRHKVVTTPAQLDLRPTRRTVTGEQFLDPAMVKPDSATLAAPPSVKAELAAHELLPNCSDSRQDYAHAPDFRNTARALRTRVDADPTVTSFTVDLVGDHTADPVNPVQRAKRRQLLRATPAARQLAPAGSVSVASLKAPLRSLSRPSTAQSPLGVLGTSGGVDMARTSPGLLRRAASPLVGGNMSAGLPPAPGTAGSSRRSALGSGTVGVQSVGSLGGAGSRRGVSPLVHSNGGAFHDGRGSTAPALTPRDARPGSAAPLSPKLRSEMLVLSHAAPGQAPTATFKALTGTSTRSVGSVGGDGSGKGGPRSPQSPLATQPVRFEGSADAVATQNRSPSPGRASARTQSPSSRPSSRGGGGGAGESHGLKGRSLTSAASQSRLTPDMRPFDSIARGPTAYEVLATSAQERVP